MISRYSMYSTGNLSTRFNLTNGLPKGIRPRYSISPTTAAPVIVSQDGAPAAQSMKWGLVASGAKDMSSVFRYKTYNHASESIFSRHSWGKAVRESRCLVPANGFYILGDDKKRAYYAQSKDGELLAFAGVFSRWQDAEGAMRGVYSIITTEATDDTPDPSGRMPVILDRQSEADWIDPAVDDANSIHKMLRPNPGGLLDVYEVGPGVYSPKANHAGLIERL